MTLRALSQKAFFADCRRARLTQNLFSSGPVKQTPSLGSL